MMEMFKKRINKMNKYPTTYTYPLCVTIVDTETKKLAQFIRDCYNLNSVSYNTPERDFLRSMGCDTDDMGVGMDLDTFNYGHVCENRSELLNTVANTMEYYFSEQQVASKEWIQEYDDYEEDELDYDEWHTLNTWYNHHKFISGVNPKNINWIKLAEDVWGIDMDMWADSLQD